MAGGTAASSDQIRVTLNGAGLGLATGQSMAEALVASGNPVVAKSPRLGRPRAIRWLDRKPEFSFKVKGLSGRFDPRLLRPGNGMDLHTVAAPPDMVPTTTNEIETGLLIVGAGPAGLAAALAATSVGCPSVLVEREGDLGGALATDKAPWAEDWIAATRARLTERGCTILGGSEARAEAPDRWIVDTLQGTSLTETRITPRATCLATGAMDRMIAFTGNDLPGVMTIGALIRSMAAGMPLDDKHIVIFATHDATCDVVRDIIATGAASVTLVDPRKTAPEGHPKAMGHTNSVVAAALGTDRLEGVTIATDHGTLDQACDILAVSGGWTPAIAPAANAGIQPVWNKAIAAWLMPPGQVPGLYVAGAAGGSFTARAALKSGVFRAWRAVTELGFKAPSVTLPKVEGMEVPAEWLWQVPGPGPRFLDFSTDQTLEDCISANPPASADDLARRFLANPHTR